MTTLELAKKLDQCLAAQVKLQEERDAVVKALEYAVDNSEFNSEVFDRIARAALAQVSTSRV